MDPWAGQTVRIVIGPADEGMIACHARPATAGWAQPAVPRRESKNPGGRAGVLESIDSLVAGRGFEPLTFGL